MKKYYERNATKYIEDTINVDMSGQYNFFMKYLSKKGKLLDIGFGSGRDVIHFSSLGYDVLGIDIVPDFVNRIKNMGYKAELLDINDINYREEFDGIWACASLLHIEREKLKKNFVLCSNALKNNGYMYCSFKYGDYSGFIDGRYFNNVNEDIIESILINTGLSIVETNKSKDLLERDNEWINIILQIRK